MPSFFMRASRVVGLSPKILAAPLSPLTRPLVCSTGSQGLSRYVVKILQQRSRHRMVKRALIEIERVMGLYEKDLYLLGKTLYPENWQTAWLSDRSVTIYLVVLTTLTVLVIAAVLPRP